jgi:hypothetical protein
MLSLIGIAIVVLVAFALFVLRHEAIERTATLSVEPRSAPGDYAVMPPAG